MSESEEKDRWNALAEELGLPPTSPQTPPAPAAHEAQRPAVAERVEASGPPAPSHPSPNLGEGREGEPPPRGRRRRHAPTAEAIGDETVDAVPPESPAEVADAPAEEERPRRRRRVRGSKKSRKPAAGEMPAAAETEEAGEEERPRRRRRRRGKKGDKESEARSTERDEEKVEEAPAEEPVLDEEEDEDTEDFSTWNVPSWAEIIAGLYRPEH